MDFLEKFGKKTFARRESPRTADKPPDAERESAAESEKPDDIDKNRNGQNYAGARREQTTKRLLTGFLTELSLIALAIWAALSFVVCVNIHYGNNMYPSIRDGDLVVTFRPQRPFLNAAVLYERNGKLCLGRVVGMPGHVINISWEGTLTVNGIVPAEEVFYPTYPSENGEISYPYSVGEGQVFILNDFRSNTDDSRIFGGVDVKDLKGPLLLSMRRRGF